MLCDLYGSILVGNCPCHGFGKTKGKTGGFYHLLCRHGVCFYFASPIANIQYMKSSIGYKISFTIKTIVFFFYKSLIIHYLQTKFCLTTWTSLSLNSIYIRHFERK